jgi:hypothetical protein
MHAAHASISLETGRTSHCLRIVCWCETGTHHFLPHTPRFLGGVKRGHTTFCHTRLGSWVCKTGDTPLCATRATVLEVAEIDRLRMFASRSKTGGEYAESQARPSATGLTEASTDDRPRTRAMGQGRCETGTHHFLPHTPRFLGVKRVGVKPGTHHFAPHAPRFLRWLRSTD